MDNLPTRLAGVKEIAQRAGVARVTVEKWRQRHPSFPAPIAELSQGPVWDYAHVSEWLEATGRVSGKVPTASEVQA